MKIFIKCDQIVAEKVNICPICGAEMVAIAIELAILGTAILAVAYWMPSFRRMSLPKPVKIR